MKATPFLLITIYNYCNKRVGNINNQELLLKTGIAFENCNDIS